MLELILKNKQQELKHLKALTSIGDMKKGLLAVPPTVSFADRLTGPDIKLIAEIKKASPSKGLIRKDFQPAEIARIYTEGGARGISVLTEEKFFLGSPQYLKDVRQVTSLPILRKDFIIDPWQVYETRLLGADIILLIAAALEGDVITELFELATQLGLECLVEVHNRAELAKVEHLPIKLLGVNNRNLSTFRTDLDTSLRISKLIKGTDCKIISESGINTRSDVLLLQENGIHGMLVGEALMREADIGEKIRELTGSKRGDRSRCLG